MLKREDFLTIDIQDGIATICLDFKQEKMNVVNPSLMGFFEETFQQLDKDPQVKGIILISGKPDFMAGADINAFKADKPGDFAPISRKGHEMMDFLENSKKPIVSAITGTCYGLGVEMSLACHARICSDDKRTKLALPEVKLGLLPGGGGTQRLPVLVGTRAALDMMLTGKNIYPRQALRMGLVDEVVNKNKLRIAATALVKKLIAQGPLQRKRKKSILDWFLDDTEMGRHIVLKKAKEMTAKLSQGNYPALPQIINCVEIGLKQGRKAGLAAEVEQFEALILSAESKALRSLFFGLTDKKKNPWAGKERAIDRFGILGAGFMGAGITEVSINTGIDVVLKDLKAEVIAEAQKTIWKSLSKKITRKQLSKVEAGENIERVRGVLDYEGFAHLDLVLEAVVENMEVKKKIITEIERECKSDVIIASNTSSLSLTTMAEHAKKPENLVGMHYFSPVPQMQLLEIVKTKYTSEETLATCYELGTRQGKTCIVVNDCPGFYVNRILAPYLNEIMLMVEEGAEVDKLDRIIKKKGMPVGPLALMDEVGIDIGAHIMTGDLSKAAEARPGVVLSKGLLKMFEAGYLGKKNKKGYYKYDGKKGKRNGANPEVYAFFGGALRKDFSFEEVCERSILLLLNEAVMCLEEGIIANATDGDLAAVFGIGFLPFTGGPFRYMDSRGIQNVVESMMKYESTLGPKFKPRPLLMEMAKEGKMFHG